MAGVKGRSGGPRANAGGPRPNSGGPRRNAGGARVGAGRKPAPPVLVGDRTLQTTDPDTWLLAALNSEAVPMKFRMRVAAFLRKWPAARRGKGPAKVADLNAWRTRRRN